MNDEIRRLKDEVRHLRFALLGMTVEKLSLRVTLAPEVFNAGIIDGVQVLTENYAKLVARDIEASMGEPRARLRDALLHIKYLEGHAARRGLTFVSFGFTERDNELMRID